MLSRARASSPGGSGFGGSPWPRHDRRTASRSATRRCVGSERAALHRGHRSDQGAGHGRHLGGYQRRATSGSSRASWPTRSSSSSTSRSSPPRSARRSPSGARRTTTCRSTNAEARRRVPARQVHEPASSTTGWSAALDGLLPGLPARLRPGQARRARLRYELGPARLRASSSSATGTACKKGLLAGERLQHDLQRMERPTSTSNRREYELTKHVSLAQLDPLALSSSARPASASSACRRRCSTSTTPATTCAGSSR